jgi:hypothetical protein
MTRHVDAYVEPKTREVDEVVTANVTKSGDGETIGVPVFFSADDIEKQGLDPTDVDEVGIRVEDGYILLVPVSAGVEGTE